MRISTIGGEVTARGILVVYNSLRSDNFHTSECDFKDRNSNLLILESIDFFRNFKEKISIHHFHIPHIKHLVYTPKFDITIVLDFSWVDCNTRRNWKQW